MTRDNFKGTPTSNRVSLMKSQWSLLYAFSKSTLIVNQLFFPFLMCIEWMISWTIIILSFIYLPATKLTWFYAIRDGKTSLNRLEIIFLLILYKMLQRHWLKLRDSFKTSVFKNKDQECFIDVTIKGLTRRKKLYGPNH